MSGICASKIKRFTTYSSIIVKYIDASCSWHVRNTRLVTVEYRLPEYGAPLKDMIEQMEAWGKSHRQKIISEGREKTSV